MNGPVELSDATRFSHHLFVSEIRVQQFCFKTSCLRNHRNLPIYVKGISFRTRNKRVTKEIFDRPRDVNKSAEFLLDDGKLKEISVTDNNIKVALNLLSTSTKCAIITRILRLIKQAIFC